MFAVDAVNDVWDKIRRQAGEAWRFFLEWLRDDLGRVLFGIILAMLGAVIPSTLLIGFGLGVVFDSALDFYWQRKAYRKP